MQRTERANGNFIAWRPKSLGTHDLPDRAAPRAHRETVESPRGANNGFAGEATERAAWASVPLCRDALSKWARSGRTNKHTYIP